MSKKLIYPILDLDTCRKSGLQFEDILTIWRDQKFSFYQLRAKNISAGDYLDLTVRLKKLYPEMKIIANDFLSLVLNHENLYSGIHLGQEDLQSLSQNLMEELSFKSRDSDFMTGISTHNLSQVEKAFTDIGSSTGSICWSYVAVGPLHQTESKPGGKDPVLTLEERNALFQKIKFLLLELKGRKPQIVFIGGLTPGLFLNMIQADFQEKYGYFPVPALISSILDLTSVISWKNTLKSYNA